MKRWHEELPLMLRRWEVEKAKHAEMAEWQKPPVTKEEYLATEDCHCMRGPGTMRKRTPNGHSHRCWMCHGPKYEKQGRPRKDGTEQCGRVNHEWVAWQRECVANGEAV